MNEGLRIVFMGTPDFAVASLDKIVYSKHHVLAVVTAPDKPAGRGKQVSMSAIKEYALEKNIPVLQPEKLKNPEFLAELKTFNADLFVVVAFRMLPEVVWNMPPKGSMNLHGSLLPDYRGAAPINWAVMNGEKETGVSTFFLTHEIDTGNIILQEKITIGENENVGSVHDRMMVLGAELLVRTLDAIEEGTAAAMPQESMIQTGKEVKHAPKIFKEDCKIDWNKNAREIHNFVRGLSPYPAAWTVFQDKSLKIYAGQIDANAKTVIGEFETDQKTWLRFGCRDGAYLITELQAEGKKRMGVQEFLRGMRF
jgi:methionyl-tRNA formyltransferase